MASLRVPVLSVAPRAPVRRSPGGPEQSLSRGFLDSESSVGPQQASRRPQQCLLCSSRTPRPGFWTQVRPLAAQKPILQRPEEGGSQVCSKTGALRICEWRRYCPPSKGHLRELSEGLSQSKGVQGARGRRPCAGRGLFYPGPVFSFLLEYP